MRVVDSQQASPSHSSASSSSAWIEWFLSLRGTEFFCEVEMDYILDKFNLQGLNTVENFSAAYKLLTDSLEEFEGDERELDYSTRQLYGLIHARYILTGPGLHKMAEKFRKGDFGKCPRVFCQNQHVLPVGMVDEANQRSVKLFCPKCQDIYSPGTKRYESIDGAHFGSSFPHVFLLVFPDFIPEPVRHRYVPKICGFRVHSYANEIRWQEEIKRELDKRLLKYRRN